jgi:hypothetical protein
VQRPELYDVQLGEYMPNNLLLKLQRYFKLENINKAQRMLPSSEMLRSVGWLKTDVSELSIDPIFYT